MDERVLRRSLCRLLVVFLIVTFALCLFPGMVRAVTLLQLTDDCQQDCIPQLEIENLVFSNFVVFPFAQNSTPPNLNNISVEPFGAESLKQGLRFIFNGELSVNNSMRSIRISYEVRHLEGDFIKGDSLVLDPLAAIAGNGAQVNVRVDLSNGQNDPIRTVIYTIKQNVSRRQLWDETLETPQAVLLPRVSVSSSAPASGQASVDSFEQIFSLVPMIDAGDDQVVSDHVALEPTGDSMGDSYRWELFRKEGDKLVFHDDRDTKQATFSDLQKGFYEAKLTVTNGGFPAVDFVNIFAAGPCEAQPEPPVEADADLKVWGLKLKKFKRCKWSFASMYGTFDFPEVDLDHNGTVNAEVSIKLLGAKPNGEDFLVKGKTACKIRDHKYKFEIRNRK
jgi:hypothetical protein